MKLDQKVIADFWLFSYEPVMTNTLEKATKIYINAGNVHNHLLFLF